jgi:hypothetical protein
MDLLLFSVLEEVLGKSNGSRQGSRSIQGRAVVLSCRNFVLARLRYCVIP